MGGKKKYIDMFVSLTEPFNCVATTMFIIKPAVRYSHDTAERITSPWKDSVYKQADKGANCKNYKTDSLNVPNIKSTFPWLKYCGILGRQWKSNSASQPGLRERNSGFAVNSENLLDGSDVGGCSDVKSEVVHQYRVHQLLTDRQTDR